MFGKIIDTITIAIFFIVLLTVFFENFPLFGGVIKIFNANIYAF